MDVSEEEVDNDYASGSEGSSVGENSLDSIEEHDDMSDDSTDYELDDVLLAASISSCNALCTCNKQLLEQLFPLRSDYKTAVFHTTKVLNNLTDVRMWSPLYLASMGHLQADVTHREAFLAFPDPEDKICYFTRLGKREMNDIVMIPTFTMAVCMTYIISKLVSY